MSEPNPRCRRCPRLAALRQRIAAAYPHHHAAPVPAFGPVDARLLVVGLAPGLHGANASGRPFTGDDAGALLFRSLHACGLASAPESVGIDDGLLLHDCRITNAVRCLPPGNRPVAREVNNCNSFLRNDLRGRRVVIALGGVAHKAIVRALALRQRDHVFGHGCEHLLAPGAILIDSYHCSRYNTQTGRLTESMFLSVFQRARELLDRETSHARPPIDSIIGP